MLYARVTLLHASWIVTLAESCRFAINCREFPSRSCRRRRASSKTSLIFARWRGSRTNIAPANWQSSEFTLGTSLGNEVLGARPIHEIHVSRGRALCFKNYHPFWNFWQKEGENPPSRELHFNKNQATREEKARKWNSPTRKDFSPSWVLRFRHVLERTRIGLRLPPFIFISRDTLERSFPWLERQNNF